MIQTEKILERTRKLSRHEKKTILYRRDDVLCDLVTEGCYSGIPRDLLKECLVMYIRRDCENGPLEFPHWLHDLYYGNDERRMFQIDKAFRRIGYCKNYNNLIMLMRGKPKEIKIDVEQLIKDLDNMDEAYEKWRREIFLRDA